MPQVVRKKSPQPVKSPKQSMKPLTPKPYVPSPVKRKPSPSTKKEKP